MYSLQSQSGFLISENHSVFPSICLSSQSCLSLCFLVPVFVPPPALPVILPLILLCLPPVVCLCVSVSHSPTLDYAEQLRLMQKTKEKLEIALEKHQDCTYRSFPPIFTNSFFWLSLLCSVSHSFCPMLLHKHAFWLHMINL